MQVNIRFQETSKPINMNCKCGVIIEHIRGLGSYDAALILDLSDKDGNVRMLRQNPTLYATQYLTAGETYYLVSGTEDGKQFVYQILATLSPDEGTIDVKPTKVDKPVAPKKAPPKPPPKPKKGK
jgi:hypothetical protein